MQRSPLRRPVPVLARAVLAGGAGMLAAGLAMPAQAAMDVPPGTFVVDQADVLSSSEESELTDRITQLRRDTGEGLYVVYVDGFPGGDRQRFVQDFARANGLGSSDSVLAIDVENRRYGFDAHEASDVNALQDDVRRSYIAPLLPEPGADTWLPAALAAADGVDDAVDGTLDGKGVSGASYEPAGPLPDAAGSGTDGDGGEGAGSGAAGALTGGLVAAGLGAGGYLVWKRSRKDSTKDARRGQTAAAPAAPKDPLDEMPLEELRTKAGSKLVAADDAIRSSEQEMGFAEAAYGADAIATFREDIAKAKDHMRASFQLQQQMEDEIPDTEQDQRRWLKEIIGRCDEVGTALGAHQKEFEQLRDLENRVPDALAELDTAVPAAEQKVTEAEQTLVRLHSSYADSALAEVGDNAEQARERLDFVQTAEDKARTSWESGDRPTAALAVRAAEEALDQVRTLTEAVRRSESTLSETMEHLRQGVAQSRQDVAEAQAVVDSGRNPELAGPIGGLKAVLQDVRTQMDAGRPDPVDLIHRLEAAHRQLNAPLAGVRDAREHAMQASRMLPSALNHAQGQIDGTADFISARRGAVGPEARSKLSEAARTLDAARGMRNSDPAEALEAAHHASDLAERASELARRDVTTFGMQYGGAGYGHGFGGADRYRRGGSSFGSGLGGAMLGGILINSILNSGSGGSDWGGGGFGGFGGGGLSGGDFGGFGDISGGSF